MLFTKKTETYSLADLTRDLEAALIKARREHLNVHAVESAIEQALNVHRSYIAANLRF